ncbi:hypothetical protein [Mycobacterium spongiae]|uniref:Uncharacterized protein n=1 Tax=Mycobacterium spongiae TaxID=886343 RepID=A0A975JY70_9MYCO|nr:hypothetical protein [Mycobacterium spongiae]QUR67490.1 hypothetical protein F6B93_10630 [Mycobacterium spongiae]
MTELPLEYLQPTVKHSTFKYADGEIRTVSPSRLCKYWGALRTRDWSHSILRPQ